MHGVPQIGLSFVEFHLLELICEARLEVLTHKNVYIIPRSRENIEIFLKANFIEKQTKWNPNTKRHGTDMDMVTLR